MHKFDICEPKNMSFNALLVWVNDGLGFKFWDIFYMRCGCQSGIVQRPVDKRVQTFLPGDDSHKKKRLR